MAPFLSFDAVCVSSPVIITLFYKKKANKQVHKEVWTFQIGVGTILKQAGAVHDIKSQ